MEVMGKVGTEIQISALGLEESATRCRFMKGALDADGDPGRVGKSSGQTRKEGKPARVAGLVRRNCCNALIKSQLTWLKFSITS